MTFPAAVASGNTWGLGSTLVCNQSLLHFAKTAAYGVQERYAEGTKQMLQAWFDEKNFPDKWYIVREGELAEQYK